MGRVCGLIQDMWVKEVINPTLKPLDQWRDELYGYWMVVTDSMTIDGVRMAIARFYGTDREALLDIWNDLCIKTDEPTIQMHCNKRSHFFGSNFKIL